MAIKRIHSDLNGVTSLQSCGIYVYANEDDITKIDAIIEGPMDTPYQGGYFYFKLKFPSDYPLSSPKVQLQTTCGGTVRFNPNLYACGKVCLSILGTWEGPSWTAGLTLSTVLLSIQSLMCEYPMKNEPGFTNHHIQQELETYNTIIRHETVRVAALGNVKRILNGISEIPSDLHWGVLEGFQKHVASGYYERVCSQNRRFDGQTMADPFGENRGKYSFDSLMKEYSTLIAAQSFKSDSSSTTTSSLPNTTPAAAPTSTSASTSSSSSFVDLSKEENAIQQTDGQDDSMNLVEDVEVSDGLKCGICYDVLATAGVLECGHTFCYLCAHKWLMKKSMCPTCREACQLNNLRRIFNLDSLCEAEAKRVFGLTTERYSSWSARKNEGIELANGKRLENKKKKKKFHYPHYGDSYDDEDMDLQDDEDEDDYQFPPPPPNAGLGMGIGMSTGMPKSYPPHHYGQYSYFNSLGSSGHVLGKANPTELTEEEEEEDLQQIIQMIESENQNQGKDQGQVFSSSSFAQASIFQSPTSSSSSSSSFLTAPPIKTATTTPPSSSASSSAHMDPQQIHELRLKKFALAAPSPSASTSSSTSSSTTPSQPQFHPPQVGSVAVQSAGMTEAETAYARAQKEKQQRELERKRLRLEIARDKEERKQHAGVLPPTHEPVLYSKVESNTQVLRAAAEASSQTKLQGTSSNILQNRSERVDSAIETICNHAGLDCTATCWKETEVALSVLSKILQNIDEHPEELKYRSINTTSKVFKEKLARISGMLIFLSSVGFTKVSSVDNSGVKQTNYTLVDYDLDLIQETRTKLLFALERFH